MKRQLDGGGESLKGILKHANETLIGTFEKNKNFGFVIPDNPRITMDIFIPQGKENGAVSGHKDCRKSRKITRRKINPEGHVKEIWAPH